MRKHRALERRLAAVEAQLARQVALVARVVHTVDQLADALLAQLPPAPRYPGDLGRDDDQDGASFHHEWAKRERLKGPTDG